MFMTAAVFEARPCPKWPRRNLKTKLQIKTSRAAGINNFVGGTYGLVNLYFVHQSSNSLPLTLSGGPYEFKPIGYLVFVLKHSIRFWASLQK